MIIYLVFMLVFPPRIFTSEELLKKALLDSEWMKAVGGDQSVDGFEIVWREVIDTGPQELVIQAHGESLKLRLEPSVPLLDPNFVLISRKNHSSELLSNSLVDSGCFYRSSTKLYSAALNLCNGMSGIVSSRGETLYTINPIPENIYQHNNSIIPHIVVKRSIGRKIVRIGEEKNLPPVHVETAVFVDKDLYDHMRTNFPTNTDQQLVTFILTMVNAVQLLYHDPSLGRPVSFIMKRLEILHSDPPGLQRFEDIDKFLTNFCTWQSEENPPDDSNPLHWDHALILTGLDLYVLSKNGKLSKQVVGLAPVAGMCNPTSSCTVNEGRHFESVYVVAHEIGHNLGMRHDGPLADNNCDPGSYLMSPTLGSGKITWSTCSKQYLNQFLRTPQSHCLMDHSSSGVRIDHSGGGKLPGERFDADQQCMLKYGPGSKHSSSQPIHEICLDLHCTKESYTWTSHPALEGTYCGTDRWCRRGRCLDKGQSVQQVYQVVKGSWSEWGSYSECASGCLYDNNGSLEGGSTGVMVASRLCNNPRPENGGDPCVGSDKKYKTCTPQQCQKILKTRVQTFANEICLRAREVDSQLTGTGYQKISSDPEEACTVWCNKKSGGILSKGWTLPDGTACQTHRRHRPMYCISGVCQEFKCSNNDDDVFLLSPGDCSNSVLFSRDKRREVVVGVWQPISECYSNCVYPGKGFQLVEKRPCRYCNTTSSIKICQPDITRCPGMRSTTEYASIVCSRYQEKVRRLSGIGIQLSQTRDDEDRPCKVACQDESVPNRFYLVNGEEGWFPFGTDCTKGEPILTAYCVSGKCLRFGSDGSPLQDTYGQLPKLSNRQKRGIEQALHWNLFNSNIYAAKNETYLAEPAVLNLTHPIYLNEMEMTYKNEVDARN